MKVYKSKTPGIKPGVCFLLDLCYAALTAIFTLPALRHFAQTFILTTDEPLSALTTWRFGSQRLFDLMCEWLIVWPTTGPFPQTSHTLDIIKPPDLRFTNIPVVYAPSIMKKENLVLLTGR
jgi:hypothetical protein